MGRHRTAQEKAELGAAARGLRAQGRSRAQIAAELRVGDDLLTQLLAGTDVPDRLRRPRAKDDARAAARALRRAGRTYDEISLELGVSKSSCSLWLRDLPQPGGGGGLAVDTVPVEEAAASDRGRARELRLAGALLKEVAQELGVSVTSVQRWCRDLPVPPRARHGGDPEHMRRMARARWDRLLRERDEERAEVKAQAAAGVGRLSGRDLLLALAVSYWCEGAKDKPWRRAEQVRWMNSDPGLVTLFLTGLHEAGIAPDRVRFRLSIHERADEPAARAWWAAHVKVPPESFLATTLKRHNPRTVRHNTGDQYRGCLTVSVVQGRLLYQVLDGMVQGLVKDAVLRREAQSAPTLDMQSAVG